MLRPRSVFHFLPTTDNLTENSVHEIHELLVEEGVFAWSEEVPVKVKEGFKKEKVLF